MTSANVVNYTIYSKDGQIVGRHTQNLLCKAHWEKLSKFQPVDCFDIRAWGYDEDEEYWEGNKENLAEFLKDKI